MTIISYLAHEQIANLAITNQGHSFVTLVVAFLLVNRVSIALGRYNEARGYLSGMCRDARELVQTACVISAQDNTEQPAKEWRLEVCHRVLLLLRLSMTSIDYPTDMIPGWKIPELAENAPEEFELVRSQLFLEGNLTARRWVHQQRTEYEENLRIPVRLAYLLRQTIHRQAQHLTTLPLQVTQELKLLTFVDSFMTNYYGMTKFLTTPVPFPLIQMAKTFLFFYIFTVPFALLSDSGSSFVAHIGTVFILTFGFMGLEAVAMELDDPFGDDPNDFDNLAMAEVTE
jgi:predicted membrane chloride channel (bestrophin family)